MSRGARVLRITAVIGLASVVMAVTGSASVAAMDEARLGQVSNGQRVVTGIVADLPAVGDGPAIRRYHRAGQFEADRGLVASAARETLARAVAAACPSAPELCRALRLAIVVDVDDTLLDWYPAYASHGFRLTPAERQSRVRSCATPVIAAVRDLVSEARTAGVAVLVVTGRREAVRAVTAACLERRGIPAWQALVLREPDQDTLAASDYKRQAVRELMAAGWRPVLSIGDQAGDVAATSAGAGFLLPNPLYRAD